MAAICDSMFEEARNDLEGYILTMRDKIAEGSVAALASWQSNLLGVKLPGPFLAGNCAEKPQMRVPI